MTVWIFSEERSGSSWLSEEISKKLNLPFLDVIKLLSSDFLICKEYNSNNSSYITSSIKNNAVFHCHFFHLLKKDINGVILRTTRRLSFEQLLSYRIMHESKNVNPKFYDYPHVNSNNIEMAQNFEKMINTMEINMSEEEVIEYIKRKKERNALWEEFSKNKQTIYYEDLYRGIDIPELNLKNIKFSDGGFSEKLKYDKRSVIKNWKQAEIWFKRELSLINNS
jgi:hypothetical protein